MRRSLLRNVKLAAYDYAELKRLTLSSLVEGDEQLDLPNSQTTLEVCHVCVVKIFSV